MLFALCILETPNGYFGKHEDPDEMPHKVAFHQDLHCLLRLKPSSEKDI